jgi:hypothetical protein
MLSSPPSRAPAAGLTTARPPDRKHEVYEPVVKIKVDGPQALARASALVEHARAGVVVAVTPIVRED